MCENGLKCKNLRLKEVLEKKNFVIPENQRGYVWDQKEYETLFSDLCSNLRKNQSSYLGTICLCTSEGNDEIIDGQQRITTFSILIHVLKERLGRQEDLLPRFIKESMLKVNSPVFVKMATAADKYVEDEEVFYEYLLNGVYLTVLTVGKEDKYRLFDSINATGKQLEIQELIYNVLCEKTNDMKTLAKKWGEFTSIIDGTEQTGALLLLTSEEETRQDAEVEEWDSNDVSLLVDGFADDNNEDYRAYTVELPKKQLNYRHFFTTFVRLDQRKKYDNDTLRAVCERFENELLKKPDGDDAIYLVEKLIALARYYALFNYPVQQIQEEWFKKRFGGECGCENSDEAEAFICALTRFSSMHLGDALPPLMRLAEQGERTRILSAYMNAVFALYMLVKATKNNALKRTMLRRLPGLEYEVKAMLESIAGSGLIGEWKNWNTAKWEKLVQVCLVGSAWNWYNESLDCLEKNAIGALRYQGDAAVITALLIGEATHEKMGYKERINQLVRIADKGGFSVEHMIPQSKQRGFDIQKLGNLMLLEKDLNSSANNRELDEKRLIYEQSVFRREINEILEEGIEKPENWVAVRTKERNDELKRYLVSRLIPRNEDADTTALAYIKESTRDKMREWIWEKKRADLSTEYIYYFDDGKNSRKSKNMNDIIEICVMGTEEIGGGEPEEASGGRIKISECTKRLIKILWEQLKSKISAELFRDAVIKAAMPGNNKGYKNFVSTEPIGRNQKEKDENQLVTIQIQDGAVIALHFDSDQFNYAPNISKFFHNILQATGLRGDDLNPVFLRYEKKEYREKNGAFYSAYAYIWGDYDKYMATLYDEYKVSQISRPIVLQDETGVEAWPGIVDAEIKSLSDLATGIGLIRVPMYQRKYVWTKDNWNSLRKSIVECNSDQYFGVILLGKRNGYYELIDGQQRLTTFSYLIPELKLKEKIQFWDAGLNADFEKGEGRYHGLKDYAESLMHAYRKDWAEKAKSIKFLVITLKEERIERAGELFTLINGRGKKLTPGEIIKNYILMNREELFVKNGKYDRDALKKAEEMWNDSDEFERFIKAYLDMTLCRFVSQNDMVNAVREMENRWKEKWLVEKIAADNNLTIETVKESLATNPGVGQGLPWKLLDSIGAPQIKELVETVPEEEKEEIRDAIAKEIATGLQVEEAYAEFLLELCLMEECASMKLSAELTEQADAHKMTLRFFDHMPEYWKYFRILTSKQDNKKKKELYTEEEKRLCGEIYLHQLAGTHTTLPALMYHYGNWMQAKNTTEEADAKETFFEIMRRFTDAFLICHLCGYENSLKDMDKRLTKLAKRMTVEQIASELSMKHVLAVDEDAKPEEDFEEKLNKDLYKNQKIALLLLWRCEQIAMLMKGEEKEFYEKICREWEKDGPSVEHIRPQSKKKLTVGYAWNYTLLEENLNSSANNKTLKEKRKTYQKSRYRMTRELVEGENAIIKDDNYWDACDVDTAKQEELKEVLSQRMAAWLVGKNGLHYLKKE